MFSSLAKVSGADFVGIRQRPTAKKRAPPHTRSLSSYVWDRRPSVGRGGGNNGNNLEISWFSEGYVSGLMAELRQMCRHIAGWAETL